ncbi:MAG TPA: hypothetical protein VKS79_16660 [Gemmataceae bacterium]|nr:hypothetical protein [Gemmataceae bacterium]
MTWQLSHLWCKRALTSSVVSVLFIPLLGPAFSRGQPSLPDPLPIQRMELPVERIPTEMDNVRRNVLKQMAQKNFDDLVQQAAQAREAERAAPRLVEARYRAVLQDDGLIGNAEWKIIQRANGPGRLSLQALQLALRKARWTNNQPARLGFLDDRPNAPLELWVEKPGEQALALEWSARGIPQPGGWRFDLRMPASPVLGLELDLPAGDTLIADGDGIRISGPLPATTANRSLWHVSLSGVTTSAQVQLPFLVLRPVEAGQPGPLVRYGTNAVQRILANEVESDFELDLTVSSGGIRQFTVDLDAGLKPRDVVVSSLEGWDTQTGPGGTTHLLIRLREPLMGGKATIRTVSTLPGPDMAWTSPGVRVVGGIARGESLQLRIHPVWQLQDWKSGRFRLANVQTASDQFQVLTLQESGLGPDQPARPETKLRAIDAVFDLRQTMDWRIEPDAMTAIVQLACQVRRGSVYELPIVFPSVWELEQVEIATSDSGVRSRFQPKTGPGQSMLHLEFRHPISARAEKADEAGSFHFTLRFRAPAPRWNSANEGAGISIPFPQLHVLGARQRDERLGIRLHPTLIGSAITDANLAAWDSPDRLANGDSTRPDFYYAFQGHNRDGTLQVRTRRSRFQARCHSEATVVGSQWRLEHRLELIPRNGKVQEVLIVFSTAPPANWQIQVTGQQADVRLWEALPINQVQHYCPALAASSVWNWMAAVQAPPTGQTQWWRLVFDRPLQEPVTLELSSTGPADNSVDLPLLLMPGADSFEGHLRVQTSPGRRWEFAPPGLQELPADYSRTSNSFSAVWPQREFEYRTAAAALHLQSAGERQASIVRSEPAALFLQPRSDQRLLVAFSFVVSGWEETSLPVLLPEGARLVTARVNGHDVSVARAETGSIHLPWMPFQARNQGEIAFELPFHGNRMSAKWEAPIPTLPFEVNIQQYWDLPNDLVPVDGDSDWQPLAKNAVTFPAPLAAPSNVWQARPGHERLTLVVVRPLLVHATGWLLAGLLAALAVSSRTNGWQWKRALLIAALVVAGWAWIWLPSSLWGLALWPLLMGGLILLVAVIRAWSLYRPRRSASGSAVRPRSSVIVSSFIILCAWNLAGDSAPPAPTPVYVLPGPPEKPAARTVLAPPELIDQLESLRHRLIPSGAMLLEARYDGRIGDDVANFEAHFQIQSWSQEKAVVTLPLSGIQLRQALLDGTDAWPRSSGADRLAFDVSGSGSHLLTLRFAVPVTGTSECEARFGIPELPITKLTVSAPAGVTRLQALSWKGAQQLQMQPEPKLEADLGRVQTVHLLWQAPGAPTTSAPVSVQEVHLWDLSETTARLQSVFRYTLGSQSMSAFEIDVPAELEVAQAAVRAVDSRVVSPSQTGLKDWRWDIQGSKRRLHLELPFPLSGQVQLHLELLSRQALGRHPALPVPIAIGLLDRQTFLAYRLQGVQANLMESPGWSKISEDSFWLKTWLPLRAEPRSQRPAQAFARERDRQGVVRLALVPPPAKGHGEQRLNWMVGPGRAELSATARWADVPVPGLLQWEVPAGIHVDEIRAPNLRSWSRTGSRLQIWLDFADQMLTEQGIVVQLTGWLPRPSHEAEQEKTPFALPSLRLHGLAEQTTTVQVKTRNGWRLIPEEMHGFLPAPDADLPGYRWTGFVSAVDPRAVFRQLLAAGTADANILTSVDTIGRQFQFQSWIDMTIPAAVKSNGPQSVVLEIRRSLGWNPQLELPAGCRLRETRTDVGVTAWTLDLLPGRHLIRVFGRRTINATDDFAVPALSIRALHARPADVRNWIAVSRRDLEPWALSGLSPCQSAELPEILSNRDKSSSQIWRVTQEDWRLRVQPAPSTVGRPQVLAEAQAAVEPAGAWLQEGRFWIVQQTQAEWAITLPGSSQLLSAWFDGRELAATGQTLRWTAKPGLHLLRLVWNTGSSLAEAEPRFELPTLQFAGQPISVTPVAWTIRRPEGTELITRGGPPRISPLAADLRVAEAELVMLRSPSAHGSATSLQWLQDDVQRLLASAEQDLNSSSGKFANETGPNGQQLAEWFQQLRSQLSDSAPGARFHRKDLPYAAVFSAGEPYCWQGNQKSLVQVRVVSQAPSSVVRWVATGIVGLFLLLGLWNPGRKSETPAVKS